MAARIERQRDEAEEERIRELTKKMEREKEKALSDQWEECERIKKEAIEEACIALTKKLRNEFVLEKEKAIAEALKIQKVKDKSQSWVGPTMLLMILCNSQKSKLYMMIILLIHFSH